MDFDYTAHYEKLSAAVKREASTKFLGEAGVNTFTIAVGHGDYLDLLTAFCYDVGLTTMGAMVANIQHIKTFEDGAGLRYIYSSVKHKIGEDAFRKILKRYRGYVTEFHKRYTLLRQEIENRNAQAVPIVEDVRF